MVKSKKQIKPKKLSLKKKYASIDERTFHLMAKNLMAVPAGLPPQQMHDLIVNKLKKAFYFGFGKAVANIDKLKDMNYQLAWLENFVVDNEMEFAKLMRQAMEDAYGRKLK